MARPLEELHRSACLHHGALVHDDDLVGEGQGLGLIVRDVDHRGVQTLVQLLELGAQTPFQMGIDHRQRLIEQDCRDVLAHQAATERDLLLAIRGEPGGALVQGQFQVQHRRDLTDARVHGRLRNAAIPKRERQVVVDGHRVVDDRELEDLRNVALVGRQRGDVALAEAHGAFGRSQQARDDVQQGGLPAARGSEQRVCAAGFPFEVQALERPVRVIVRSVLIGVPQVRQPDARHVVPAPAKRCRC